MRKVAKKVCKLSLFSQLSAPIKSGVMEGVSRIWKIVKSNLFRLFIMRSDSKLLISCFRSGKKRGLLMQSDFTKIPTGQNLI